MPFDGFVTKAVQIELKEKIRGAKINNVYQYNPNEISLSLRAFKKNYTLLISTNPVFCRVHLTGKKYKTPEHPPPFCMLLRKYLKGGIIKEVSQFQGDRILDFNITRRDEFGLEKETMLTVEIMGKHSNIILVDKNKKRILDGLKKIKRELSNKREIFPGVLFERPPAQEKQNPWDKNPAERERELENVQKNNNAQSLTSSNILFNCYQGISPLLSKELAYRAGVQDKALNELNSSHIKKLQEELANLMDDILNSKIQPVIIKNTNKRKLEDFYLFPVTHANHLVSIKTEEDLMGTIDKFYISKEKEEKKIALERELKSKVNHLIKKNKKKLKKQEKEFQETLDIEKYKIYGELLTANLYQFAGDKPYRDKVEVLNYYKDPPENIEIKLDQSLSPSENAQRYFKKYQKTKKRKKKLKKEINKTKTNIEYLENISFYLDAVENLDELETILEELNTEGFLLQKKERKEDKKTPSEESMPLKFTSTDGYIIWVGKNNKQNDYLTLKMASSEDTWLHTKEIAGSHVVVKGKDVPFSTIKEAASLAAYYSKGRYSSNVPVDYTKIKHVRKPKGAKPGMVIYDNHKTLFVEPNKPPE